MSDTTMLDVLAALETRWTADLSPDGVQVIYGPRVTRTVTKQSILTIGGISFEPTVSTFGTADDPFPVDEAYDITCAAECTVAGTDQHAATAGALGIYKAAFASLSSTAPDETLGVPGVLWARILGRGQLIPATDLKTIQFGRSAAVSFLVRVQGVL
jgi:hypothetical protein